MTISLPPIEAVREDGEWTFYEDVKGGKRITDWDAFADEQAAKIADEIRTERAVGRLPLE